MKILNLYACLGGNRFKWNEVKKDIQVTAVELDPELAKMYQERFPDDTVIVADAHGYLLNNYQDFDFIWSSPPCPTHSSIRVSQRNRKNFTPKYPDMNLYQEIILLQSFFKGKYCVENVRPYYKPLIQAQQRGRHLYWANFKLPKKLGERKEGNGVIGQTKNEVEKLCNFHEYDFYKYKGSQRRDKIARNLVYFEVGKTILEIALGIIKNNNTKQKVMF